MIIREEMGDLFDCQSQTITCTTNATGAMGKGVALDFRDRIDGLFGFYRHHYPSMGYTLTPSQRVVAAQQAGKLLTYPIPHGEGRQVLLFPTKIHWRDSSPLELIEANLRTLMFNYQHMGIESLAIPALGCGNGHLNYDNQVRPLIWAYLNPLPIPVEVLFRHQTIIRY